jgi:3-hydroxypropanoate dehydrogenase
MRNLFAANPALIEVTARRNSSLQGAYLMLAARALGIDCGPMSGFDNAKLDEEFFGAGKNAKAASRSSFRRGTSSRTFCAISVTEIHPSSCRAVRVWNSTRRAR